MQSASHALGNPEDPILNVYTYSEARQKFASVLDTAKRRGKVLVRRRDGSTFAIIPEKRQESPLDVKGVRTAASTLDIVKAVRESRAAR